MVGIKVTVLLLSQLLSTNLALPGEDLEPRLVEVDSLTRGALLSRASEIFTPSHTQKGFQNHGDKASHSVRVSDQNGRFMSLEYSAEHPSNAEFLKMDLAPHSDKIRAVNCSHETEMVLHMHNHSAAKEYHQYITATLSNTSIESFFLVGSHLWVCRNHRLRRYAPILRKIVHVTTTEPSAVRITTEYVDSYAHMFKHLDFKFTTNMKVHDPSFERPAGANSPHGVVGQRTGRRLNGWFSSAWDWIVDGIETVVDAVETVVEGIVEVVTDIVNDFASIIEVITGQEFETAGNYTTGWSYDISGTYLDTTEFVYCASCYASLDLTFVYHLTIDDLSLEYLKVAGIGAAELEMIINLTISYSSEVEETTPKVPIPYLGFSVFGIEFGFDVYGALGIGVNIDVDNVIFAARATGSVARGIEYTKEYGINYINDNDFDYSIAGPLAGFDSASILGYVKPTLYLELDYIGNVYFGVQTGLKFTLTENSGSTDCVIDYTPSAQIFAFVGGELDPFGYTVWSDELNASINIEAIQSALSSLEGCITQSDLTTYQSDFDSEYLSDAFGWDTTDTSDDSDTEDDDGCGGTRRRLQSTNEASWNTFTVDYTNTDTLAYVDARDVWGKSGNEWWGKMSSSLCDENLDPPEVADVATLLLHVKKSDAPMVLTGVYQTDKYNFALSSGHKVNLSCITRLNFTETGTDTELFDEVQDIPVFNFHVSLLEYYCNQLNQSLDLNRLEPQDKERVMNVISLDGNFSAIAAGSHFRNIFVFDTDSFCHSFVLSKHYTLDLVRLLAESDPANANSETSTSSPSSSTSSFEELEISARGPGDPSTSIVGASDGEVGRAYGLRIILSKEGWFGAYYCLGDGLQHVTMYFQRYDSDKHHISSYMTLDGVFTNGEKHVRTRWLYGTVDFGANKVCLNSSGWNETFNGTNKYVEDSLNFCGYLTLLDNGELWLSGNATVSGQTCTGFVAKGFVDMSAFLETSTSEAVDVTSVTSSSGDSHNEKSSNDEATEAMVYGLLIGVGAMGFVVVGAIVLLRCLGYTMIKASKMGSNEQGMGAYQQMNEL